MRTSSSRRLAIALAAGLALAADGALAQPVASQPGAPVAVPDDAPPGTSKSIAVGAGVGVIAGLILLLIFVGSASGPS